MTAKQIIEAEDPKRALRFLHKTNPFTFRVVWNGPAPNFLVIFYFEGKRCGSEVVTDKDRAIAYGKYTVAAFQKAHQSQPFDPLYSRSVWEWANSWGYHFSITQYEAESPKQALKFLRQSGNPFTFTVEHSSNRLLDRFVPAIFAVRISFYFDHQLCGGVTSTDMATAVDYGKRAVDAFYRKHTTQPFDLKRWYSVWQWWGYNTEIPISSATPDIWRRFTNE